MRKALLSLVAITLAASAWAGEPARRASADPVGSWARPHAISIPGAGVAQVSDTLDASRASDGSLRVSVLILGRGGSECSLEGSAKPASDGSWNFSDDEDASCRAKLTVSGGRRRLVEADGYPCSHLCGAGVGLGSVSFSRAPSKSKPAAR